MTTNSSSFIPRESGSLPRILLLDFDQETITFLSDSGYSVFAGYSGLGELPFMLPKHQSEIEIILWDTSKLRNDQQILTATGSHHTGGMQGARILTQIETTLKSYFERVRDKGGFVGIFLGIAQVTAGNKMLPEVLGTDFSFFTRRTSTLSLKSENEDDIWYEFFRRFVSEQNIKYGIEWNGNFVGLQRYFNDEDDNWYGVYFHYFALIPKIEEAKKNEAVLFLLQDILPSVCDGENIYPDKHYYRWANKETYLPPRVQELRAENLRLATETTQQIEDNKAVITSEMTDAEYLSNMLVADDSDLFPAEKKLSVSIHKVLEDDFGFSVTDVDAMRLQVGESLKEDKWIEDADGFFALVEIKGTERGAKANWVRVDLNAHIREFEVVKGISGLKSLLVFNHERRVEPEERETPFNGDSDLIAYCQKSDIRLVPVYELFKMVRDIKTGILPQESAREMLKEGTGLFVYTRP